MKTVVITGGTGLVGKKLTAMLLDKGYNVIVLARKSQISNVPNLQYAVWNVDTQTIDEDAIKKANYIVHLAGAGVADKRWTEKRKQEIVNSRTQSSSLLVKALQTIPNNVAAVISASAIGWYGPDPSVHANGFEENDLPPKNFLSNTCKAWEESINPVEQLNKRLVKLRIGIVLSQNGGALKEFIKPIKMGVAAILGNGQQIVSWIHIDDLCRAFIYAIENNNMQGVYNAVASQPVSNKTLTLQIAKTLKGKWFIPVHVPSFVLKIMLGEMSIEVLKSTTVSNSKLKQSGFSFGFDDLEKAINNLLKK